MTTVWANESYNQKDMNLNRIMNGVTTFEYLHNADGAIPGPAYEDSYARYSTDGFHSYKSALLGHGFKVSETGVVETGTVNAFFQCNQPGNFDLITFGFTGFEISAVAFYRAIMTESTVDDFRILSSILAGNDMFTLSQFDDYADGYSGNDQLAGGAGKDSLSGGSGQDTLNGGLDADSLDGGIGNDILFGDAGSDRLIGGGGADSISGGAGADVFVLNQMTGVDHFTDFTSASDRISLSKATYTALGPVGTLAASAFYAAAGATKGHLATDRVVYNTATGALYYDADGSGSRSAVQIAVLDGHPTLAYTDVLIF